MYHVSVWNERMFKREEFPTIERISEVECNDFNGVVDILEVTARHAFNIAVRVLDEGVADLYEYDTLFVKFSGTRINGTIEFKIN